MPPRTSFTIDSNKAHDVLKTRDEGEDLGAIEFFLYPDEISQQEGIKILAKEFPEEGELTISKRQELLIKLLKSFPESSDLKLPRLQEEDYSVTIEGDKIHITDNARAFLDQASKISTGDRYLGSSVAKAALKISDTSSPKAEIEEEFEKAYDDYILGIKNQSSADLPRQARFTKIKFGEKIFSIEPFAIGNEYDGKKIEDATQLYDVYKDQIMKISEREGMGITGEQAEYFLMSIDQSSVMGAGFKFSQFQAMKDEISISGGFNFTGTSNIDPRSKTTVRHNILEVSPGSVKIYTSDAQAVVKMDDFEKISGTAFFSTESDITELRDSTLTVGNTSARVTFKSSASISPALESLNVREEIKSEKELNAIDEYFKHKIATSDLSSSSKISTSLLDTTPYFHKADYIKALGEQKGLKKDQKIVLARKNLELTKYEPKHAAEFIVEFAKNEELTKDERKALAEHTLLNADLKGKERAEFIAEFAKNEELTKDERKALAEHTLLNADLKGKERAEFIAEFAKNEGLTPDKKMKLVFDYADSAKLGIKDNAELIADMIKHGKTHPNELEIYSNKFSFDKKLSVSQTKEFITELSKNIELSDRDIENLVRHENDRLILDHTYGPLYPKDKAEIAFLAKAAQSKDSPLNFQEASNFLKQFLPDKDVGNSSVLTYKLAQKYGIKTTKPTLRQRFLINKDYYLGKKTEPSTIKDAVTRTSRSGSLSSVSSVSTGRSSPEPDARGAGSARPSSPSGGGGRGR